MQTAISKLSQEERRQYEEYEVSAIDNTDYSRTPVAKADKKIKQKKDALAALEALGLDGNNILNLANKFGTGANAKELQIKRETAVKEKNEADKIEKKEQDTIKSAEIREKIEIGRAHV